MQVHILNIESMKPIKKIGGESWGGGRRPPQPPSIGATAEEGIQQSARRPSRSSSVLSVCAAASGSGVHHRPASYRVHGRFNIGRSSTHGCSDS